MEEPLIIDRMLFWKAPNREDDCEAGVANGSALRSCPGRGDQAKSGDRNIFECMELYKNREDVPDANFGVFATLIADAFSLQTRPSCLRCGLSNNEWIGSGEHMQEQL